jgi:hypothetical protein
MSGAITSKIASCDFDLRDDVRARPGPLHSNGAAINPAGAGDDNCTTVAMSTKVIEAWI